MGHIPNIHALNSDTHTLSIQYEYTQKQCVSVAIEGKDNWYMALQDCIDCTDFSNENNNCVDVTEKTVK